jgi:hypothetical protein
MITWEPIKREGHPEVRDLHGGNRLNVAIQLSALPPTEWVRFLLASYEERSRDSGPDFPMPRVEGKRILIAPLDAEFADWVRGMDKGIEEANTYYETAVLPLKQAKEQAQHAADEQDRQRLDDARRTAEEL